jgi:hypothetical protein
MEREQTIALWRNLQSRTLKMEPFPFATICMATHHLTVTDSIAIAIGGLIVVDLFFDFIGGYVPFLRLRRGCTIFRNGSIWWIFNKIDKSLVLKLLWNSKILKYGS